MTDQSCPCGNEQCTAKQPCFECLMALPLGTVLIKMAGRPVVVGRFPVREAEIASFVEKIQEAAAEAEALFRSQLQKEAESESGMTESHSETTSTGHHRLGHPGQGKTIKYNDDDITSS